MVRERSTIIHGLTAHFFTVDINTAMFHHAFLHLNMFELLK